MTKFAAIVLWMFVGFYPIVHGDTITLKNDGKDINLKVTGVSEEYINATILKKDIKSLNMQFLNSTNYPDVIFMNVANAAVECKIKEIKEDAVQVLIPTSAISSLKMSFQPAGQQAETVSDGAEGNPGATAVAVKKEQVEQREERVSESEIRENGEKSRIADEIRTFPTEKTTRGKYYRLRTKKASAEKAETEGGLSKAEAESMPAVKNESVIDENTLESDTEPSEPKQKLADEFSGKDDVRADEGDMKKEKPVVLDTNLGRVEGRILHSGKPLPDCQVKLQMLEKGGLLVKGYRPVEGAVELETITDKDGVYHFLNVSPGLYKLYWKPPSETTWVRRFKMEPDVIVDSGKLTNPKAIETLKRTLN